MVHVHIVQRDVVDSLSAADDAVTAASALSWRTIVHTVVPTQNK